MKKRIISLCMAIVLITTMLPQIVLTASAATSGTCGDNLTWVLDKGTLTISGTGKMDDFDAFDNIVPWNNYKESIKAVVVEKGVTSIGSQAFSKCKKLSSVSLPEGITELGWLAFHVCDSLTSITIPEGVIALDNEPISACYSLTKIEIPSSVTTIDAYGLSSNDNLLYVYVSDDNPNYSDVDGVVYDKAIKTLVCCPVGRNNLEIPDSVTHIGENAFTGCNNLSEIILPDGITHIGVYAFSFLYHQTSVSIPSTVQHIEDKAFFGNAQLTYINVADDNQYYCDIDGVLYDKEQTTLIYCPNTMENISIPNGVTRIEDRAFEDCSITAIEIPNSVTEIGEEAFSGCKKLEFFAIPASVTDIGSEAFKYCTGLKSVSIKGKMTELQGLFSYCVNLESVELPDSVLSIGSFTFIGCSKLTSIVIPTSVYLIDEWAFYDCKNLSDVYYCGDESDWSNIRILSGNDGLGNAVIHYNYRTYDASFTSDQDGWSFANSRFSFREDSESPFSTYYIPEERYDEVFGTAYLDSHKFSKKWGGNCAGMSTTAILFFQDYLDWQTIDDGYPNDFSTPNSFYQTINYHYASKSGFAAIGNATEVTRLIEAYQLFINEVDRSEYEALLNNTYHAEEFTKDGIFSYYTQEHLANGTYIGSMLEVFSRAYEENTPLYISLKGDDFGHAIVSRTDKKPEDMGNGWWRVYVYDPNKPYINESIAEKFWEKYPDAGLKDACNDLLEDVYIELSPSQNLWRYCTSVNSDSSSKYLGCNLNNEVQYIKCDATDGEGNKLTVKIPEYFYTIDLNDVQISDYVHPATTAWMPDSTEDGSFIFVDGVSDCLIYSSAGNLIAIVENGEAVVLNGSGYYSGYIGEAEESSPAGGKLYLPSDTYTVQYTSGLMAFLGGSNVISISADAAMDLTVDIAENYLQILATDNGTVSIKCARISSADECSYVETEGSLVAGESFTVSYSDNGKVEASTDSKDGEFQLYQKKADQDEAVATKVVKSSNLLWIWIVGGVVVAGALAIFVLKWKKK